MKKVLLLVIITLLAFSTIDTVTQKDRVLDFDDIEYIEVVKV